MVNARDLRLDEGDEGSLQAMSPLGARGGGRAVRFCCFFFKAESHLGSGSPFQSLPSSWQRTGTQGWARLDSRSQRK